MFCVLIFKYKFADMSLQFQTLTSGSKGNATLIACNDGLKTRHLLLDCGITHSHLKTKLQASGIEIEQLDAIFISHEHDDHIGCAHALALNYRIPVYMSCGTHNALKASKNIDFGELLNLVRDSDNLELAGMQVHPFTVPHDAREPLQLRCSDGNRTLAIATDLGHATSHVLQHLKDCNALILEANHDVDMLAASNYPEFLKKRIAGQYGHLNNAQAAEVLTHVAHQNLSLVVAAHLSENNNRPELAKNSLAQALKREPSEILIAQSATASSWLQV